MAENFVLRGNICYSENKNKLNCVNGYVVCEDGKSAGVFEEIPQEYMNLKVIDYEDCVIIPGLTDLHIHAPQYSFRGLGMDLELLDWLNTNTFPEEAKYKNLDYANEAYNIFVEELRNSATTRACIFATMHVDATLKLMDLLEESGLKTMVGKVNMDRNSPEYLCENTKQSISDTINWIKITSKYNDTKPILTPRFIPTCSDELMNGLHEIRKNYKLPLQSHLSENKDEIKWVKNLCPWSKFYGDAYDHFDVLDNSIMAHCVYSPKEEVKLLEEKGVYIAHCPQSNTNLSSGIAPAKMYLERGMRIGLGSDVAGGFSNSILRAMADSIQVSKLRWRLVEENYKPLTIEEAFFMGSKGGGAFFGNVGSFEKGYELDAVVIDDVNLRTPRNLSIKERLERIIYLSDKRNIKHKYVSGRKLF